MTVAQGSQVLLLCRRHPDHRKAILHGEQVQNQLRIPPIMLLLPRLGRPDLRRMANPTLNPQLFQ
jgi:hypothetical protein